MRGDIRRRERIRLHGACGVADLSHWKQERPRGTAFKFSISVRKSGAGEGIRTLDPNLGKVVLYP